MVLTGSPEAPPSSRGQRLSEQQAGGCDAVTRLLTKIEVKTTRKCVVNDASEVKTGGNGGYAGDESGSSISFVGHKLR